LDTDHSAFDAYSFLIEAGGKRVLYTGDFRDHGRKLGLLKRMTKGVVEGIDAILLEGTLIGRDGEQKNENDIENEFCELFRSNSNTVFIAASGQNIDRMVSVFRAAKRSGRTMVVDPYVAHVLTSLSGFAKLPYPSPDFPDIKVYFPQRFCSWLTRNGNEDLFKRYAIYKISRPELHRKRDRVAMLIRPSLLDYLKKMEGIDGATVVWSQWEGYLKDDKANTNNFIEFIQQRNMKLQTIHTSGHATIDTMKNLVAALKPKVIIPIHTNHPERYAEIFPKTTIADVQDRISIEI
jgi:ribonuclease J